MPRDGLSLAVRVGSEVDGVHLGGRFAQSLHDLFLALNDFVVRGEIVGFIHADAALGQVPDVAHAGLHQIAGAQKFLDGLHLGGRFDDNETFAHVRILLTESATGNKPVAQDNIRHWRVTSSREAGEGRAEGRLFVQRAFPRLLTREPVNRWKGGAGDPRRTEEFRGFFRKTQPGPAVRQKGKVLPEKDGHF